MVPGAVDIFFVYGLYFNNKQTPLPYSILFPVPIETLKASKHEHMVVRLLMQLATPVPSAGQSTVDTRSSIIA